MNMRTCLLVCALLLAPAVWSRPAGAEPFALENALQQKTRQAACPLYSFYQEKLNTYYARTDFTDPDRHSGWYRVQDFLSWLKQHESVLKTEEINVWMEKTPLCGMLLETREENTIARKQLSVYLGARYALSRLGYEYAPDTVAFYIHPRRGAADFKNKTLFIPASRAFSEPEFINLGIHEIAHLLPLLLPDQPQQALGELAAFYTQFHFALPLKPVSGVCFSNGVRHMANTLGNTDACAQILNEYNSFLAGAILGDAITQKDLLSYRVPVGWERSVSEVLFHLILLENGKLRFSDGVKTYVPSETQYAAALLPPGMESKALLRFYNQWIKRLPDLSETLKNAPELILDAPGVQKEETPQEYFSRQNALENFLSEKEDILRKTLQETLKESKVRSASVPDGYI